MSSIIGSGTRSESIGMIRARGRTTACSSATIRISLRRISGTRNPPSDGIRSDRAADSFRL